MEFYLLKLYTYSGSSVHPGGGGVRGGPKPTARSQGDVLQVQSEKFRATTAIERVGKFRLVGATSVVICWSETEGKEL